MFLNLGGITLNLFLDPFFMIILDLGTAGAALATLLAKAIPAMVAFGLLCRQENDICLNRAYMRLQREKLGMILKIGLPTAIGGSTMQLGFLLMSKNVFVYGTEAMAAYGIGNKVNGLITLPSNAIGSATATIVGQNMGAKQQDRAEKGYRFSMWISVVFLFIGGMILSRDMISTAIVGIFSKDAEVVGMAADFLSVMAFWCFMNFVEELRWRGMLHDMMPGTEELLAKEQVTAYIGFDPTADSLHIGHLCSVMILRHFQRCGHKPMALIGGATGMIGDPSGKSAERNLLTEEILQRNLDGMKKQLSKFLDFESDAPNRAELVNNYDWMKNFTSNT